VAHSRPATFTLLAQNSPAAVQILTFKSSGTEAHGVNNGQSQPTLTGNWTLTFLNKTLSGGNATATFRVTSGLGPGNVSCAGRKQDVKFIWQFNRDATFITSSEPLSIELTMQADSGACAPNNPFMYTWPQGYFQQSPPLTEANSSGSIGSLGGELLVAFNSPRSPPAQWVR
jgi:hypothetical protein